MNGINKVNIMGRLGNDPEIGQLNSGGIVATLSLATSEVWTDKQNQRQERTEWHRVVFYGRTAEIAQQYLNKGRAVNVFGKLKTRQWQDKEGNTRYTTEIIGNELHMIDSANTNKQHQQPAQQHSTPPVAPAPAQQPMGNAPQAAPSNHGLGDDAFASTDQIPF